MASKTQQLQAQRDAFYHAVETGDIRTAKILFSPALAFQQGDDQAKVVRAVGRSLTRGPAVFEHAREKYPEMLLGSSPAAAAASPALPKPGKKKAAQSSAADAAPPCALLAALKQGFQTEATWAAREPLLLSPQKETVFSASCAAVAQWLFPLLAKNPEWRQSSFRALPGVFWHFLPDEERERAFEILAAPRARLHAALSLAAEAIALSWPEAFERSQSHMAQALAAFSPEDRKEAKATVSRALLRMAAEAGPCVDRLSFAGGWLPQPTRASDDWAAFKTRQARLRPALIEAALREAASLATLQWARSFKDEDSRLPTPLEAAAGTLNVAAWAFLQGHPAKATTAAGLAAGLSSAARNWSALPDEAAALWAQNGRANPNDAFSHPHAPWAAASPAALLGLGAQPLASLYASLEATVAPVGFGGTPKIEAPENAHDCARGLARLLLSNNPLMGESVCLDLVSMVSRTRGFEQVAQPSLLSEWLMPALAKEGASIDFPAELVEQMGEKSHAIFSAIAIERELAASRALDGAQSASASRPAIRRL